MRRWAIYIDIEGFSQIYTTNEVRGMRLLGALMEAIYCVGSLVFDRDYNRVFVHQTGDGFVIVSDGSVEPVAVPCAVAVILMRHVLLAGGVAKCGLAEGDFADVQAFYPEIIRNNKEPDGTVRLGSGFMRLFPVMGSALVRAHQLTKKHTGSLLLVDQTLASQLPASFIIKELEHGYVAVDWIHSGASEIAAATMRSKLRISDAQSLEESLHRYVTENSSTLRHEWIKNTLDFNGCSVGCQSSAADLGSA